MLSRLIQTWLRPALLALIVVSLPFGMPSAEAATKNNSAKTASAKKKAPKVSRYGTKRVKQPTAQQRREQERLLALSRLPHRVGPTEIIQATDLTLPLNLESRAAVVMNAETGEILYGKNVTRTMPIASITKLMTAMVVLDARLPLDEEITISQEDTDSLRHTSSRLAVGTTLTRGDAMLLALMSSENRAAAALARTYPGGTAAAVAAMNRKAAEIGMVNSHFADGSGLNGQNTASPTDLVRLVRSANTYSEIRHFSTTAEHAVVAGKKVLQYRNTNALVANTDWDIAVSKTGFLNEAGKCLVMQAKVNSTPVVIVLMDSNGRYTRIGDANRVKKWLESEMAAHGITLDAASL